MKFKVVLSREGHLGIKGVPSPKTRKCVLELENDIWGDIVLYKGDGISLSSRGNWNVG